MDYVIGSVAALISGNVTPSRPKLIRRALTPTKHQPSPNVTPKSEFVEDRSIFLSPSLQKKKAIVKKSPKRIFENPDSDGSEINDGTIESISPKADKVKKHLKGELDSEMGKKAQKSPKIHDNSVEQEIQAENESTPKKKKIKSANVSSLVDHVSSNDSKAGDPDNHKSPKKMKQRRKSILETSTNDNADDPVKDEAESSVIKSKSPKKQNKKSVLTSENAEVEKDKVNVVEQIGTPKNKNKKRKNKSKQQKNEIENNADKNEEVTATNETTESIVEQNNQSKNKNKKHKNKSNPQSNKEVKTKLQSNFEEKLDDEDSSDEETYKKKKKLNYVNPNAITDKDSDSEHESDNEIESENEQINNEILKAESNEESSEEEEEEPTPKQKAKKALEKKEVEKKDFDKTNADEVKRTIFVGNVPFTAKCKKEIKKIFSKHGQIETIRIRTVPVKDARVTPKLAVIKNELHPERTTVNVYVKFADAASVDRALSENNTTLSEHHLRVSRSDVTGSEHDPRLAVFVGNLPFSIEDNALRAKFESCGDIHSVRIIRDKKTNAGKGFGYVNFSSKDGVELALALTEEDLTIKNRILRVKRCTHQKPAAGNNRHKPAVGHNRKPGFPGNNQKRKWGEQENDGAVRRLKHKRQHQEGAEGPPQKRQKPLHQPKEKKARKEFVGMTAEKKKKQKFSKGQKKKKVLSEILTK